MRSPNQILHYWQQLYCSKAKCKYKPDTLNITTIQTWHVCKTVHKQTIRKKCTRFLALISQDRVFPQALIMKYWPHFASTSPPQSKGLDRTRSLSFENIYIEIIILLLVFLYSIKMCGKIRAVDVFMHIEFLECYSYW